MAETILQTQGLTKRFGDLLAVDNLTLEVRRGEILGFLGPNGAGKTTSIRMMCGLLQPDAGQVLLDGIPIQQGEAAVKARLGVCFQANIFWEKLTCLEQLQFIGEMYGLPARIARQRSSALLETLGLEEKRNRQAGTLSGGMKRRLNLALALVHDPEILILDEPEAGLDPQSRVMVREYIRSLARQKTVILTTHNMDEADRLADRVAIIDHGKLLVVDAPEALKHTVGEGDVLEIDLKGDSLTLASQAITAILAQADLAKPPGSVSLTEHTLVIRELGIVDRLPAILEALKNIRAQPGEVRLRTNTLEDVFIQLTGRSLRE